MYSSAKLGEPGYGQPVVCQCVNSLAKIKEKQTRLWKYAMLPDKAREMTFGSFTINEYNRDAFTAANRIVSGELKWLTLVSEPNHGKTHLLMAIANEWLKGLHPARYVYAPMLFIELRSGFENKGDESYRKKLDQLLTVPLLLLDDLGVEKQTPWVEEQMDLIVDTRLMNKLPLVVTTNTGRENMTPRVASRLQRVCDDGFGDIVLIEGPPWSNRKKKNALA